jgi:hypothetical protein
VVHAIPYSVASHQEQHIVLLRTSILFVAL